MPPIGVLLNRGNTGANVRELHNQLIAVGAVIAPGEQTATNFGDSTVAAVRVFRERYGLPAGDTVDLPTGRLMHVASQFAESGDRVALRAAVREAAAATDNSQPQELYWLARYATLAGDYQTAHSIALLIPDHGGARGVLEPLLELPVPASPQPRPPEVPYPENFYAYRRPWVDPSAVERVALEWPNLQPTQFNPAQGVGGPAAIAALRYWNEGNNHFNRRRYAAAIAAYDACQDEVLSYFDKFYLDQVELPAGDRTTRLVALIKRLYVLRDKRVAFWDFFQRRRELLALAELEEHDRIVPGNAYDSAVIFAQNQLGDPTLPPDPNPNPTSPQSINQRIAKAFRERNLDAPLVTVAFVLVPLARAEANRARRQYDAALRDLTWVLNSVLVRRIAPTLGDPGPFRYVFARLACEFIELPFAKLLLAETMLDKADGEYKARIGAEPAPAADVTAYQGLKAAQTYLAIKDQFNAEGEYVARVDASREHLAEQIELRLAVNDTRSPEFQLLGKDILVPTLKSFGDTLPGLDRRAKAHEPLLKFTLLEGQVMRETNPRVYAALLTAAARLEQLRAGFNYLGYLDSYVPPWRFQFLLERARYFAEHAKNAQREYLNFLSNAEREEFQELSTSQNVEMEKSNVRIETARVDQVGLEVAASQQSKELAELTAVDAKRRLDKYREFDDYADELFGTVGDYEPVEHVSKALGDNWWDRYLEQGYAAAGDFFSRGAVSGRKHVLVANAQRDVEKFNLDLAEGEALKAVDVATAQLNAAAAGLVIAGLQRQAALLRHEFALQNLEFLRNRVLNAELWYRLVAGIRSVSETYLRYSVELAFLAEQAYEFEADKRINVIRFDYDLSEVGDFLAADFLMRDLDTLEQDLVVTQRQRQQQVRYVLSMAREFPQALQDIRDNGKTTFSLRLEQLEKRFPGLYNLRIGAVDVLPVALMDSTRFSLEFTHLGTSQVRLKAQPDTLPGTTSSSPLNTNDLPVPAGGWLAELQDEWPIKLRVTGPETAVYSGMSRQEANAVFPFATTSQRHAFEALGAAAAWQVDFTARENQVVPETLADLLITFTMSGYHDPELRTAIDAAKPQTTALISFLSARQNFPDAFYEFSRTGRMVWKVPREILTLTGELGRLRNIGFSLRPGVPNVHFSRLMTRLRLSFRVDESAGVASGVTVLTAIPETSVTQTGPLTVAVRAAMDGASELAWDFGDGTPILRTVRSGATPIAPAEGTHTYAKPGRYVLKLRCVKNGSLSEFRVSVVVSRDQKLGDPLIVHLPGVNFDTTARTITITTGGAVLQAGRILWRVGDLTAEGNSATFALKPGNHTLEFAAVRSLNFKAYSAQRYVNDLTPLSLRGLNATTNRTFDQDGVETNGTGTPQLPARNELAKRLFNSGEISPADDWFFELIPQEILGVPDGTAIGAEELDLRE
ncbi:MAG: hypothetical protein Q8S00_16860 [Deltaproteobacteria bacterium]|nr:hypothetical protein [Deltaproteobacteria bacterium]